MYLLYSSIIALDHNGDIGMAKDVNKFCILNLIYRRVNNYFNSINYSRNRANNNSRTVFNIEQKI